MTPDPMPTTFSGNEIERCSANYSETFYKEMCEKSRHRTRQIQQVCTFKRKHLSHKRQTFYTTHTFVTWQHQRCHFVTVIGVGAMSWWHRSRRITDASWATRLRGRETWQGTGGPRGHPPGGRGGAVRRWPPLDLIVVQQLLLRGEF